jgi:regulator of nucleoside diphosphate kinase
VINGSGSSSDFNEMQSLQRPPIVLTTADRDRLVALLCAAETTSGSGSARFLREELERADIAPDDVAPASVVKMGSRVKFVDHADVRIHRATLVFPGEVEDSHRVSVLSSVGSALIGLGPGQSIQWTEQGGQRSLAVLEVSAGDASDHACKGVVHDARIHRRRPRQLEFRGGAGHGDNQESSSQKPAIQGLHPPCLCG